MLIKNEKQLINFVKYSPIVVIIFITILVNVFIYFQNDVYNERDLKLYEKNYIETNKKLIKDQIESIHKNVLNEKQKLEDELKIKLMNRIDEVYTIVDNINKKFFHEGKEKVIKIVKESLRNIRFNDGRGYFYIHDINGKNLMHPIQPELEGKSLIDVQDKKGFYFMRKLMDELKKKDSYYLTFYWYKPNFDNKLFKKITINKKYEPLDLVIGTGEYLDDFEKEVKKYILEEYIDKVSFGKNGYIFVVDYDGVYLSHVKKSYIGVNRIDLKDSDGFEITKEIIKVAKNGSGYIRYIGTVLPETGKPASKTTYIKGINEWNWAIATGFYDKDLQQYLKRKEAELVQMHSDTMKKTIAISIVLSITLIFLAMYVSKILKNFFDSYNERILREINSNRKKDLILYQQAKMASMGEMIGNIAHQWRQPLTVISTAASKVKFEDEMQLSTKDSMYNSLDMIIKSSKYLSQTIDDFREFFNPNKIAKEFSTKQLFEKTLKLTSSRFDSKDIQIIADIEDIELISYENELIQALINIVNNSVDAFGNSNENEKLIFLEMKKVIDCDLNDCRLYKNCKKTKNYDCVSIVIKDNAKGIAKEHISKVFEAYFTTKHQSQGTGIGLYMTYQIITKHLLGNISVENEEFIYKNKKYTGAKFSIILPLQ